MTKLYGVLTQACGSLAVALLAVALTTATAQVAYADEATEPIAATCDSSNGQTCTVNDVNNPTDCDAATKDKVCDSKDSSCVCRFGKVSLDCTCGYK